MKLALLPGEYGVCRLSPDQDLPQWVWRQKAFLSITYTSDELSIVCPLPSVPAGVPCEKIWKVIKVQGPLDFSLIGILAALTAPLAAGGISIFAVSTFDTDYLLVKEGDVIRAREILEQHGHNVEAC